MTQEELIASIQMYPAIPASFSSIIQCGNILKSIPASDLERILYPFIEDVFCKNKQDICEELISNISIVKNFVEILHSAIDMNLSDSNLIN